MDEIKPIPREDYPNPLVDNYAQAAKLLNKRLGGGIVPVGLMRLEDIAEVIVPGVSGFDARSKKSYTSKSDVFLRKLEYEGIAPFEKAVVIGAVKKYMQDPQDYFMPLDPNTIDEPAAFNPKQTPDHKEIEIFGMQEPPNADFQKLLYSPDWVTGCFQFRNNGNSLEMVVPKYYPGKWMQVVDCQTRKDGTRMDRQAGMYILTRYHHGNPTNALFALTGDINYTHIHNGNPSDKIQSAFVMLRSIMEELNIK